MTTTIHTSPHAQPAPDDSRVGVPSGSRRGRVGVASTVRRLFAACSPLVLRKKAENKRRTNGEVTEKCRPAPLPIVALLLAIAASTATATAQKLAVGAEDYKFMHLADNHLRYDSTSATMGYLLDRWQRMVRTGEGSLSIVHIGGSHVQAGTLPNTIRCNILAAHPTLVGPRGLIFPYSAAAKCNNPADYRIHCPQPMRLTRNVHKEHDCPLGVCGIAVTAANEPTEIQVVVAEPTVNYRTSGVVLLGHSEDGIVPRLRIDGEEIFPSYIDHPTDRYIFNLSVEVDSFVVVLPCRKGDQFTVQGIYLDSRYPGFSYHSIGVNGASVPDYLRCRHFVRDLRLLHPDLVIFGIGINDAVPTNFDTAAFHANYRALVDSVRSVNPDCAFIFVTNNDSYRKTGRRRYSVNNNGPLARQVFYDLARETGGAVWDQFAVMGGLKSMEQWYKAGLARADRVHFTAAGYRMVGNLFSDALAETLRNHSQR